MLELILDPVVFATPHGGDLTTWGDRIQRISSLTAHPFLRASSPERVINSMVATWYSAPDPQVGPATFELARFAHEAAARLATTPECSEGAPLLDNIKLDPDYVAPTLDKESRSDFEFHLGEAACAQRDGGVHVGILGPPDSWKEDKPQVLVEGEILARDDPTSGLTEVEESEALLREFLNRSDNVREVLAHCCDHACALLADPDFGVRAMWAAQFGGDPWSLDFEIGPEFIASTKALNFDRRAGEARRCLRVMALIAGGRAAEVDGHDDRETEAATSPIRKDRNGNTVVRSRLQNRVPDADRLFWARDAKPVFLNVAGHQGGPVL
jgi:hypothetical protein